MLNMILGDRYIMQCRHNTLNGITPSNPDKYDTVEYKAVIAIGREYIEKIGVKEFSGFFRGDQYFIELWTAHIIFEYGNPDSNLKAQCINSIKKYSDNPISPVTSIEEQKWLEKNGLV